MESHLQTERNEHDFKRVIPGDIDSVRCRLADALESFNFDVLSEQPLQARRVKTKNVLVATLLEQDTRLNIALKSLSPVSTLATFDYSVEATVTKCDHATLEREADAIVAVAATIGAPIVCPACNAENPAGVRFCRVCGTPAGQGRLPAEIEVMRLTDGARTSYKEIIGGVVTAIATMLLTFLLSFSSKPKAHVVSIVISVIGSLITALMLFYGLRRLRQTLNPPNSEQNQSASNITRAFPGERPSSYLLESEPASVTEGTTRMMDRVEAASSEAKRSVKTTDPID